jgi:hypothetical protein
MSASITKNSLGTVAVRQRQARIFFLFVLLGILVVLFIRRNDLNNDALSPSLLLSDVARNSQKMSTEQELLRATAAERDALAHHVQALEEQIQQQQQHQQTDDSPQGAFPYRLTCPGDDLPGKPGHDYKIALAYHVGMKKNWKTIVHDQLNTLKECGLGAAASDFILSYSGGSLETIQNVVRPYNLFVAANTTTMDDPIRTTQQRQRQTILVNSTQVPWEGPIMNQILDYCIAQEAANTSKPTIVFYFHNKGSSKFRTQQYQKTLYWRKYMEYYLHERPSLCLNELLYKGAGMCGIMWHKTHFSGNFWSANCHYIATRLKPIDMKAMARMDLIKSYIAGELWIGTGRNMKRDGLRPVSLHENPSGIGLYRHAVEPHEYSDYHLRWKDRLNVNRPGTRNKS